MSHSRPLRIARAILPAALALAASACRSPFAEWEEGGPPEDPQKVGVGVHGWPLYERDPGRAGVRTDVLWPMASVRTSPDGELRRADLLVPIVLVEKDGTRSRFGIRPLFDVETDENPDARVEDVDLLFPIVKWREAPDESRFEFRPLWFSGHEGDERWTVFVPFGGDWDLKREQGWFAGPFAGGMTHGDDVTDWYAAGLVIRETDATKSLDGTKLLLGAFESTTWDGGRQWRAFPLVWHRSETAGDSVANDEETFLLWPGLVGWTTEGDERTQWAVPVWYHQEEGDEQTTMLFPLWYSQDGKGGHTRVLFPVYGSQEDGATKRTFWGGNLLITTEGPDESATDVVWPLFHAGSDATGWDARLFPVLWLDRHGDRESTHLWPLFGVSRDGSRTETSVAWPFFTVTTAADGWEADLPLPLVSIDRRGRRHETRLFPLWSSESDTEDGSYEGNVLWLLSNWEGDGKESSDFRILWRLVQATDTGERSVFALNPFFRHETNARGDDHWSALFGLVGRTREGDEVSWRLLWFLNL